MHHDLAIIGLGLIGSGALRHAALQGQSVVGIGPPEPALSARHDGPFSSHYDSGRITRRLDARREWAVLATRAIEQYPIIESTSGITFHDPVGMVFVRNDASGIANQREVATEFGIPVSVSTTDELAGPFHLPSGWTTLYEPAPAGLIDPREMIRAQHRVAQAAGARVLRSSVSHVRPARGGFELTIEGDDPVRADRVIVATGAWGDELTGARLAAAVRPEAVMLAELDDDAAAGLQIPSMIYLLDHPDLDDVYIVPPVRYPDGRWYLKMGGSLAAAGTFASTAETNAWMRGSGADLHLETLREVLTMILPSVPYRRFAMKPCVITDTETGLPFIGQVGDGLTVARAGNGHAAKSADAIGALAVDVSVNGDWNDADLDAFAFSPRSGRYEPPAGSRHAT